MQYTCMKVEYLSRHAIPSYIICCVVSISFHNCNNYDNFTQIRFEFDKLQIQLLTISGITSYAFSEVTNHFGKYLLKMVLLFFFFSSFGAGCCCCCCCCCCWCCGRHEDAARVASIGRRRGRSTRSFSRPSFGWCGRQPYSSNSFDVLLFCFVFGFRFFILTIPFSSRALVTERRES